MSLLKIIKRILTGEDFDPKEKSVISNFVDEKQKSDFTFVIAGKTQSGKSSLVNLLFNPDPPQKVVHGMPTTKEPDEIQYELDNDRGMLTIVDLPGICESQESKERIESYYKKYFSKADAILWLSRVDVSADQCDQEFYSKLSSKEKKKIVFGISQLDAARGGRWNYRGNKPGKKQLEAIGNKIQVFQKHFKISDKKFDEKVVLFSTERNYNIDKLEYAISKHIKKASQFGYKLNPALK